MYPRKNFIKALHKGPAPISIIPHAIWNNCFSPQVTTHNWPTLDWNFCVPGTWVATTEGGYSGQTFDMKCNDNERGKSIF